MKGLGKLDRCGQSRRALLYSLPWFDLAASKLEMAPGIAVPLGSSTP